VSSNFLIAFDSFYNQSLTMLMWWNASICTQNV